MPTRKTGTTAKTYTISLANRKARGSGHERLGEILAAAKALFLEHGFENVSTRKIAERVGISQTALFAYYKTKDDIFGQLIRDAFGELAQALAECDRTATDERDWMRRCVTGYVAFGLSHPDEYRLAFMVIKAYRKPYNAEQPDENEEVGEGTRVGVPVFMQLTKRIEQAIEAGVVRADLGPPLLVAQALWASIHGLVAILIARPRPHFPWEPLDELIRVQTDMLLNGLLTERDERAPTRTPRRR
ncbi:TetR/AcrR family transcriptional regulator [Trinickia symbiotica]|uniref:TetR/AcrR family transcriptional regulator n=1 Tax=Trinickia symbiotica TaxID=863227 RepID=A0A2T3XZG0_9BURK|nr:TetR/AcrR family transcriptional regulator [Trinickia symbiotica]PTB21910.1 TetR/AcrR family transcriptional regulator [Trinickia symbiotica]